MSVALWGRSCAMTFYGLQALLAAEVPVVGLFLPAFPAQETPIAPQTLPDALPLWGAAAAPESLAGSHGIPVWRVADPGHGAVAMRLAATGATVAASICYPRRVPPALLAVPALGFWNVHPSKLPAFRGPQPLFWQFRAGLTEIAVTVHQMDAQFDHGPILAQAPLTLSPGCSGLDADRLAGHLGGQMLASLWRQAGAGPLTATPQPAGGHYDPPPQAADFALDRAWPVARAFHFMRGTAEWGHPYRLAIGEAVWWLRRALAIEVGAQQDAPVVVRGDRLGVAFADGVLWAVGQRERGVKE